MALGVVVIGALFAAYLIHRSRHRQRMLQSRLPGAAREYLEHNVWLYRCLPEEVRERLDGPVNLFLSELTFEGAAGLEIDDGKRLIVAAQACLLTLNNRTSRFARLSSIILYPSTYVAKRNRHDGWLVHSGEDALAGEAWSIGAVTLAWDEVVAATSGANGGHNVVLHEFAHVIDYEDGDFDGLPGGQGPLDPAAWRRVMQREYARLRRRSVLRTRSVIDTYGAQDPSEFFAVITEHFFHKPHELFVSHPEVYGQLRSYYGLNPVTWVVAPEAQEPGGGGDTGVPHGEGDGAAGAKQDETDGEL